MRSRALFFGFAFCTLLGGLFIPKALTDDTSIFLVSGAPVPPNVMLLLDNSGSMLDLPCAQGNCDEDCDISTSDTTLAQQYFISRGFSPSTTYPAFDPDFANADCNNTPCTIPYTGNVGAGGQYIADSVYRPNGCALWSYYGDMTTFCSTRGGSTCTALFNNYGFARCSTTSCSSTGTNQIYYSGNLLNFYPPKFVVARKVLKALTLYDAGLPTDKQVRMGVADFNSANTGAHMESVMKNPCSQILSQGPAPPYSDMQNAINNIQFDHYTPLAGALLDIAQYYVMDDDKYCQLVSDATCAGAVCQACGGSSSGCNPDPNNIAGATPGNRGSSSDPYCTCFTCQRLYAIVITDGMENSDGDRIPRKVKCYNADNVTGCDPGDGTNRCYIDEAASLLHNLDLRDDVNCTQGLDTYTIGFGISDQELERAALYGGGTYSEAVDYESLKVALIKALNAIITKTKTTTPPSLPSLRSSRAATAYIASFKPKANTFNGQSVSFWEGHLFAFTGTTLTTNAFQLFDACGNPISSVVYRSGSPDCVSEVAQTLNTPQWEAGQCLSWTSLTSPQTLPCAPGGTYQTPACYVAPGSRNIYTVMASDVQTCTVNGSTIVKPAGAPCTGDIAPVSLGSAQSFTTTNTNLAPLMNLSATGKTLTDVVYFMRGPKDNTGRPPTTTGNVLGDIFHSVPTPVGRENCFAGGCGDKYPGYTDFISAHQVQSIPKIIVAGANDGMIHAFHAGEYNSSTTPGTADFGWCLANRDECYTQGTGQELWAFIPKDLLPQLQYMLVPPTTSTNSAGLYISPPTNHVYFIDGSPMLRDAFLPGIDNGLGLSGDAAFWHTVLIVGLRLGGTFFFALDITDTRSPKFLWEFTDPEMAYTFTEPFPNPAPIGPVHYLDSLNNVIIRHVVFLNGGLSVTNTTNMPDNAKGRSVYVVDIASGTKLWQYKVGDIGADKVGTTFDAGGPGTNGSRMIYSIPATIGAVDSKLIAGFFDTFYVGDIGGQLWRFDVSEQGQLTGSGMVKTCASSTDVACWTGRVTFQAPISPTGCSGASCVYQPIDYIPTLTVDSNFQWRALFGTGDRMNPMACSPDGRFYGLRVSGINNQTLPGIRTEADLSDMTCPPGSIPGGPTCTQGATTGLGWLIRVGEDLNPQRFGGKVLGGNDIFHGVEFFNVFIPSPLSCGSLSGDVCTVLSCSVSGGEGFGYAVDFITGGAAGLPFTLSSGRAQSLGAGIPSAPVVSLLVQGGTATAQLIVGSSEGGVGGVGAKSFQIPTNFIFWLDVPYSLHTWLRDSSRAPWSTH